MYTVYMYGVGAGGEPGGRPRRVEMILILSILISITIVAMMILIAI